MAESVVSYAVQWIADLLIREAKSFDGVRGQVEDLLEELNEMRCLLKDADAKQDENLTVRNLVSKIREVTYEAENVIASFLFKVDKPRKRKRLGNFLSRSVGILGEGKDRHNIASEIISIKAKITRFKADLQTFGIISISQGSSCTVQRQSRVRRTYSHVVEEDFVGFEPDIKIILSHLVREEAKNHRAISICGMGGLGKTTLARKVYHHEDVRSHFDAFAWVSISQQWQLKDVLQRILTKLLPEDESDRIANMIEDQLVEKLYQVQQDKKCLVVLDDIWSLRAWDNLSPAFPMGNKGSKIILTTRNEYVAAFVDQGGFLHEPKCLAKEESWNLFEKKAFSTDFEVDERLKKKNLGMKMVEECKGLPLAIVVLGGLLRTKHTLGEWQIVHQRIDSLLKRGKFIGGQEFSVLDVLALSYQDFPYHLKACFLYLGNYPEDFEIEAETLYQLWMAESIVSQEDRGDKETMMDVAERYLGELAQRCMVQVEFEPEDDYSPIRGSRRFKHCRLHDLMRDLCLSKGKEENFLKVMIKNEGMHPSSSSTEPSGGINGSKTHRLAIHQADNSVQQSAHHIRAVSFFMDEEFNYQAGYDLRHFSKNSKFLRVIHFDGRGWYERSTEVPKEVGNLILLRYLGLKETSFTKLPSSIGKLRYLQTLDLRTWIPIIIPNVLWKMEGLIHIYFPLDGFSIEGGLLLRLDGLSKLETIENLDLNKVDVGGFSKLTNLQRLTVGIEETLEGLVVFNNYLLNSKHQLQYVSIHIIVSDLRSVEELSLLRMLLCCDCLVKLHILGFISKLPECEFSPTSLTRLRLFDSRLNEDPLATLEKLPNLRSLTLINAFVGKEMVCSAHGFRHLQVLALERLETLEEWKVDDGAMHNLSSLSIDGCKNLKMVPDGLRFISTLKELRIRNMPIAFQDRLRVIDGEEGEDFQKIRHIPSIILE